MGVLALDIGGTVIKSAYIENNEAPAGIARIPAHSDGTREEILSAFAEAVATPLRAAKERGGTVEAIGVSTPGPFDYKNRMSLMRHKYVAIHGIDLGGAILERTGLSVPIAFFQDANSFLAGERGAGAARGFDNCALVTLGTGLGFSAMVNGQFLTNGYGGSYVALYRQPWKDGIIEDAVSGRGVAAAYARAVRGAKEGMTAKDVAALAQGGDPHARAVFGEMGRALGVSIGFHLTYIRAEILIIGGQISKAFPLFEAQLTRALLYAGFEGDIRPCLHPEDAALYGAAECVGAQAL